MVKIGNPRYDLLKIVPTIHRQLFTDGRKNTGFVFFYDSNQKYQVV